MTAKKIHSWVNNDWEDIKWHLHVYFSQKKCFLKILPTIMKRKYNNEQINEHFSSWYRREMEDLIKKQTVLKVVNLKGLRVYMWMFGFFVHLYMGIWCMAIDVECPWAKSNICKIDIIKKRHCVDLHHFCKPQKFIQLQVRQFNETILKNPNERSLLHLITKKL